MDTAAVISLVATLVLAGLGLILAAVKRIWPKIHTALLLIRLVLFGIAFAVFARWYLTRPAPWANVSLNCYFDVRESQNKTSLGDLPSYAAYASEYGNYIVKAGQPPQYDMLGALLQLSAQPFPRCYLKNDRPEPLFDVKLTFLANFIHKNEAKPVPRIFVVDTDSVSGNGGDIQFRTGQF